MMSIAHSLMALILFLGDALSYQECEETIFLFDKINKLIIQHLPQWTNDERQTWVVGPGS